MCQLNLFIKEIKYVQKTWIQSEILIKSQFKWITVMMIRVFAEMYCMEACFQQ